MIAQPGDGAFNMPAAWVGAGQPDRLEFVFRPAVFAVWSNHLNA